MYKVKYVGQGILALQLEKGHKNLESGKPFDLEGDGRCSRQWIKGDPTLDHLINGIKIVVVTHDSEENILPKHDLRSSPQRPNSVLSRIKNETKEPVEEKDDHAPMVIDLSAGQDIPDEVVENEEKPSEASEVPGDAKVATEPPEDKEDASEDSEDTSKEDSGEDSVPEEVPSDALSREDLESIPKKELIPMAKELGITIGKKKKDELIDAILEHK